MTLQMSMNDCSSAECSNISSAAHDAVVNTINYKDDSKYDISIKIEVKEKEPSNRLETARGDKT